jgi:hypothetical protein
MPHLRQDAFASISRFYPWERSQEYVIHLGATFVNIDCGRRPLDWSAWEVTQILRDLAQRGLLAQPSMYQFSGWGLWVFWLLRDEQDPSMTHFANYENRELWMSLQQRTADVIAAAFPSLNLDLVGWRSDPRDSAAWSVNAAAERQVRYELLPGTSALASSAQHRAPGRWPCRVVSLSTPAERAIKSRSLEGTSSPSRYASTAMIM